MIIRKYDSENIPPEFKGCLQNQSAPLDNNDRATEQLWEDIKKARNIYIS